MAQTPPPDIKTHPASSLTRWLIGLNVAVVIWVGIITGLILSDQAQETDDRLAQSKRECEAALEVRQLQAEIDKNEWKFVVSANQVNPEVGDRIIEYVVNAWAELPPPGPCVAP